MITYRDIAWFAVVIIIVVFLSRCHRDKAGIIQAQVDSLVNKSRNDQNGFELIHKADSANNSHLSTVADSNKQQAGIYESKLIESESKANRIAGILSLYKAHGVDDGGLTVVDNGYTIYCDSLTGEVGRLALRLNDFRRANNLLITVKDNQITGLDSSYRHTLVGYYECKREFTSLTDLYKKSNRQEKPRNQVFIGAELIGGPAIYTQATFVHNVGAVLSIKTAGNKLWQISGGLQTTGNWYARINGNFLISFK